MLAIRTDAHRPNTNVLWSAHAIKSSTDPALAEVRESYLRLEKATQDLSQGWWQQEFTDENSTYGYYLDSFGPEATEESIFHLYYMYREKFAREFGAPWVQWVSEYRRSSGIITSQRIVQISNP